MKNCLQRTGTKAIAVSRFREKLSPANWMQGVTAILRKISRSWAPRLQNSRNRWAKKWGPTCDRDISNSAIYTTAMYRAYTVHGFKRLGKDNCKTRRETFKFWDLACLILEIWWYQWKHKMLPLAMRSHVTSTCHQGTPHNELRKYYSHSLLFIVTDLKISNTIFAFEGKCNFALFSMPYVNLFNSLWPSRAIV